MATQEYEAIFVKKGTKKKFKLLAVKKEMIFDELLLDLIDSLETKGE